MTRDPLDDLGISGFEAQHPGLGQLFSDLASPPVDSELAGQQAALSMFRAARAEQAAATQATAPLATAQQAGATGAAPTRVLGAATGKPTRRPAKLPPGQGRRPVSRVRAGDRLRGQFRSGRVTRPRSPAPLQRVAHQILGFAGFPIRRIGSPKAPTPRQRPAARWVTTARPIRRRLRCRARPLPDHRTTSPRSRSTSRTRRRRIRAHLAGSRVPSRSRSRLTSRRSPPARASRSPPR